MLEIGSLIALFVIALLGGTLVFFKASLQNFIAPALAFSGAYLLGICLLHLLPELFSHSDKHFQMGQFVFLGFLFQLILDFFSGGIEHGHTHINKSKIGFFPILVLFSLCIHALLEAIPLIQLDDGHFIGSYLAALVLHKIPISFVLVSLLLGYKLSKAKVLLGLFIFASMGPLGAWIGANTEKESELFHLLLAISVGIILHLSTTILLESNEKHQIKWKNLFPLLFGFGLAMLSHASHATH